MEVTYVLDALILTILAISIIAIKRLNDRLDADPDLPKEDVKPAPSRVSKSSCARRTPKSVSDYDQWKREQKELPKDPL